jgi:hypothetical protein
MLHYGSRLATGSQHTSNNNVKAISPLQRLYKSNVLRIRSMRNGEESGRAGHQTLTSTAPSGTWVLTRRRNATQVRGEAV